jgi:hypothetical protein
MPRPNIRPWRDLAELLTVRQLLYPNKEFEHDVRYDSQRLGVNMVSFLPVFQSPSAPLPCELAALMSIQCFRTQFQHHLFPLMGRARVRELVADETETTLNTKFKTRSK